MNYSDYFNQNKLIMEYVNLGPQKYEPKHQEYIPIILWVILCIALFILCYLSYLCIANRLILYMENKNKNKSLTYLIIVDNHPVYDI